MLLKCDTGQKSKNIAMSSIYPDQVCTWRWSTAVLHVLYQTVLKLEAERHGPPLVFVFKINDFFAKRGWADTTVSIAEVAAEGKHLPLYSPTVLPTTFYQQEIPYFQASAFKV